MDDKIIRLLVAEDGCETGFLLEQVLTERGFAIRLVKNGLEALEALKSNRYDCVLTDLVMPEMGGRELISRIRRHDDWNSLPIIILSALDGEDKVLEGYEFGADDYITKPFNFMELSARIRVLVEKKDRNRAAAQLIRNADAGKSISPPALDIEASGSLMLDGYGSFGSHETVTDNGIGNRWSNRLEKTSRTAMDAGVTGLEGRIIKGFRIERLIGHGAMGDVYLARQISLDRPVALKVLSPEVAKDNPSSVLRFLREARSAARLVHPNVVQIFDAGEEDSIRFIAMEYVEGDDLKKVLKKRLRLPEAEAMAIVEEAAQALAAAEEKGIIHRDIKPANIILTASGQVKIADFGLARGIGSRSDITLLNQIVGSPAYMSPEQARGGILDNRSDIFSLGITLHELLTGSRPFGYGGSAELLSAFAGDWKPEESAGAGLSEQAVGILMKMLAKDPTARFQSAKELVAELRSRANACAQAQTALNAAAGKLEKGTLQAWPRMLAKSCCQSRRIGSLFASAAVTVLFAAMAIASVTSRHRALGSDLAPPGQEEHKAASILAAPGGETSKPDAESEETGVLDAHRPAVFPAGKSVPPETAAESAPPAPGLDGKTAGAVAAEAEASQTSPVGTMDDSAGLTVGKACNPDDVETMLECARSGRNSEARAIADRIAADEDAGAIAGEIADAVSGIPDGLAYAGLNGRGMREYRNTKDGMILVLARETPASCGGDFLISKFEVTRGMFSAFLNATGCAGEGDLKPCGLDFDENSHEWVLDPSYRDYPVTGVTWIQARAFCSWAAYRGDLPSEAVWEFAALGRDGRRYPWGNAQPDGTLCAIGSLAGVLENVGLHPSGDSPLGVRDMAGNAYEWVLDSWSALSGEESGAICRVVKGSALRPSNDRIRLMEDETLPSLGFRYAVPLSD